MTGAGERDAAATTVRSAAPEGSERRWIPTATTMPAGRRVVVFAPHADDESLGCGGTIARHADRGDTVTVVVMTDGAAGDPEGRHDASGYTLLREAEARKACEVLGVRSVEFWGIPDRGLQADEDVVNRCAAFVTRADADLVYSPSPFEFHPDHVSAARIVWEAVGRSGSTRSIAFYEVNHPFRINTLVDITTSLERKKNACNQYQSQLERLPYTELALSLNRFRSLTVSSTATHAEGLFVVEPAVAGVGSLDSYALRYMTMRDEPAPGSSALVSIIVRTKDRPSELRDALWSIAAQTYRPIETIVVRDGGAEVKAVVDEIAKVIDIRLVSLDRSVGRSAAGNAGFREARGEYAMFLDDDDVLLADHVAKLAGFLESTGQSVGYSDCRMVTTAPDGMREVVSPYLGYEFDRDKLMEENFLPLMTVMFRSELFGRAGGFDESLDLFEDWDLWIRLSSETGFARVPGVTAEYRLSSPRSYDIAAGRRRIYEKNRDYWSFDRLYRMAWGRIERLESEQRRLIDVIQGRRLERLAGKVKAGIRAIVG